MKLEGGIDAKSFILISLTGLTEEIVGDTGDEFDGIEKAYEILDDGTFLINGSMRIEDANEEIGLGLPGSEDYETIAGFILSFLKHMPEVNEKIEYKSLRLVVTEMQGFKIEKVHVTKQRNLPSED